MQVWTHFSLGHRFQVNVVEWHFRLLGPQNRMGPCDYGTYNQKSSRILFLQHLMISLFLQLALFTAEGDH